jgi:hypothetical protein
MIGQHRSVLGSGPSRREFLYVGLIGALGLTLPDYFVRTARADIKHYPLKPGVAQSIIHIWRDF